MADNVAITAGAGTTVATDEVNTGSGSAHVQLVKLLDGTDGGTDRIQGTAANGLEVDVTRLPALAAGTNNIGDVDVLSVVPGTSATSLGKAEDAVHSSGDTGVMALGVRQSSQSDFGADGDYVPLSIDDDGGLRVSIVAGAGSGGTAAADDADFSAGTTQGTPAMGVYESSPSSVTDGDLGTLGITQTRALRTSVEGAALTSLQLIDNLVLAEDAAHQSGDVGIQMLAVRDDTLDARSGAENDYEPLHTNANGALWTIDVNSAASAASLSVLDDWDETDRAKVNIIAGQAGITAGAGAVGASTPRVTLASDDPAVASLSVLDDWDETDRAKVNIIAGQAGITAGAGSVAANTPRVTMASDSPDVTALQIMDDWDNGASDGASVSGDVAHDTADAGEPVKLGHKAIDLGANPTDVAANDRTNWYSMRNGVPFVMGGAPFVKSQNLQVTDADGAQTDTAILTAAANVAIMVTAIEVTCDNANTGDVSVRIGFGTANTPAADADKVIMFHPGIAPGSGVVKGSGAGIIGAGLSGEDLRVTCEDPAGGSISITVTYFTLAIG